METVFTNNINSISKNKQYIKKYYGSTSQREDADIIAGVEVIGKRKILYAVKDELQYQLDSLYSSEAIVNRWVKQIENTNYRSRYLIFGLGNGMYVERLLENTSEQIVVVVVEPSIEIFKIVMQQFDISKMLADERLILLIEGMEGERFIDVLRVVLQYEDVNTSVVRTYINYPQLFKEKYKEFHNVIQHHSNCIEANHIVMIRMGHYYFENSMGNYLHYKEGKC